LIPNNTKRKQNICGGLNRIGNKAWIQAKKLPSL
jgi:hypothetical protein